jgi:type IV secretion system protein VirB10
MADKPNQSPENVEEPARKAKPKRNIRRRAHVIIGFILIAVVAIGLAFQLSVSHHHAPEKAKAKEAKQQPVIRPKKLLAESLPQFDLPPTPTLATPPPPRKTQTEPIPAPGPSADERKLLARVRAAPIVAIQANNVSHAPNPTSDGLDGLDQSVAQAKAAAARAQQAAEARTNAITQALTGATGSKSTSRADSQQHFLDKIAGQKVGAPLPVNPPPTAPTLMPGSVIPAVLLSRVNSDLPGQIVARITQDVYDTIHTRTVVIPHGSTLVGYYSSNVANGQTRVLASFSELIFPDGRTVYLHGMGAADAYGQAGMDADVNTHFWKRFGASFLIAALSTLLPTSRNVTVVNATPSVSQAVTGPAGQALLDVSRKNLQRYQNLPPTLIVHQGFEFNIMVNRPIVLRGAA